MSTLETPDPSASYRARANQLQNAMAEAGGRSGTIGALAAMLAIATLVVAINAAWWMGLAPGVAAVFAARNWWESRKEENRSWRLKLYYDRALKRVDGEWAGHGITGEQFDDLQHPYAHDLNLFGEGSLFELLCIGRSGIGQRGLAELLKQPVDPEIARVRQAAVRELSPNAKLREQVALLGPHSFSESRWETLTEWLDSPPVRFPEQLGPVLLATSCVLALIGLSTGGTLLPWMAAARVAAVLLAVHAAVGLTVQERVRKTIRAVSALPGETQVLREGLALMQAETWTSPRLQELARQAQGGAEQVRKLERLLSRLAARNNDMLYLPSLLLAVGTQLAIAIERWRREHGAELRQWMEAWAEFEALAALSGYAYEHPDNVYPELVEGAGAMFEARELGHPLLSRSGCVRNDVRLDQEQRFYIISGSNMAGKSTLLRTIGLNAVLAGAGAPVRAEAMRMSRLAVCASISVADSLLNGKSKFLAEVERLKLAIETARDDTAVLFLVDEIFSGTNSSDRRIAAEAVVRTLIERGAIGALSTHDLALTEMAESEGGLGGVNVHMGSRGMGDPMDFDYRLKPGVTREANALAIARMAGVPGI